jgi:hypothetical protein
MEKGGYPVDTHCGSPLSLLFHGQRYVASVLDLFGSYLTLYRSKHRLGHPQLSNNRDADIFQASHGCKV